MLLAATPLHSAQVTNELQVLYMQNLPTHLHAVMPRCFAKSYAESRGFSGACNPFQGKVARKNRITAGWWASLLLSNERPRVTTLVVSPRWKMESRDNNPETQFHLFAESRSWESSPPVDLIGRTKLPSRCARNQELRTAMRRRRRCVLISLMRADKSDRELLREEVYPIRRARFHSAS